MAFLSGDLDRIFTVLFEMGRVEPLLNKDWKKIYRQAQGYWGEINQAIGDLNSRKSLKDIREYLEVLPPHILDAIVIEVARELAEYQSKPEEMH